MHKFGFGLGKIHSYLGRRLTPVLINTDPGTAVPELILDLLALLFGFTRLDFSIVRIGNPGTSLEWSGESHGRLVV